MTYLPLYEFHGHLTGGSLMLLLWVRTFDTVEELRLALLEFKARYNREWLIERHGYQTLAAVDAVA